MSFRDPDDELNDEPTMDNEMSDRDETIIYGDSVISNEDAIILNNDEIRDDDVVIDPSAASSKRQLHSSRRSIEDYLERKKLREELGSVFEDEDDFDINLDEEEDLGD